MRRVLLLVCLIVSVVELDWERDRIYLLSSIASLLLVLYSEQMRRRKVQREATQQAFKTTEGVSSVAYISDSLHPEYRADHIENRPTSAAIQEVALMHNNSG
jgi:hypothetical protein